MLKTQRVSQHGTLNIHILFVGGIISCLLEGSYLVCWRDHILFVGGIISCLLEGSYLVCWKNNKTITNTICVGHHDTQINTICVGHHDTQINTICVGYPRNVRNVFILLFFYVIIWLDKIYTVVVTVWLTAKKYLYLKLQRLFYFLRITDQTFYWTRLYIWIPRRVSYKKTLRTFLG
jgi:hypothetical protein